MGFKARAPKAFRAQDIPSLLCRLKDASAEYWRTKLDEERVPDFGKPCSAPQLRKLEKRLGFALPPSYRAFFEHCDGFGPIFGDARILSTEEIMSAKVHERIRGMDETYFDDDNTLNPFRAWNAVPIVLGKENHYVVLDPRQVSALGEMPVVHFDYGEEERRFPSIVEFLVLQLELAERLVKKAKVKSPSTKR